MSGSSQRLRKPALLAVLVAVVGLVVTSAAAAPAAVSAAQPFELIFDGGYGVDDDGVVLAGTFASKAPFCESGSAADAWSEGAWIGYRFACADGSGSITLQFDYWEIADDWRLVEATGRYAGLRGRGTSFWAGSFWDFGPFRGTFQGAVAQDAVAPTVAVVSANASKVKGTKSIYTIPVVLDIRDDVEDNPVDYKVIVTRESGAGPWLAQTSGQGAGGASFELRIRRPNEGVRAVLIRTTAVDPVGNESSLDATVRLPR